MDWKWLQQRQLKIQKHQGRVVLGTKPVPQPQKRSLGQRDRPGCRLLGWCRLGIGIRIGREQRQSTSVSFTRSGWRLEKEGLKKRILRGCEDGIGGIGKWGFGKRRTSVPSQKEAAGEVVSQELTQGPGVD
jgi:hypothetical protein